MDSVLAGETRSAAKLRRCRHGAHYFERSSGLNVLLDEIRFDPVAWHRAPRYVSVALTNACELRCPFCYAPKRPGRLDTNQVLTWARELDREGALGIGFGGGEPTAHPDFAELCRALVEDTDLAVSFTTHSHRMDSYLAESLRGYVHFIRVSVDGVGSTYERLRGRSFGELRERVELIGSIAPFGINTVVTDDTVAELDACLAFAESAGARELLLLAEQPADGRPGLSAAGHERLTRWLAAARSQIRLAVGAPGAVSEMGLADPFGPEPPLEAHAHVDARGLLRADAFATRGVSVVGSIMDALDELVTVFGQ